MIRRAALLTAAVSLSACIDWAGIEGRAICEAERCDGGSGGGSGGAGGGGVAGGAGGGVAGGGGGGVAGGGGGGVAGGAGGGVAGGAGGGVAGGAGGGVAGGAGGGVAGGAGGGVAGGSGGGPADPCHPYVGADAGALNWRVSIPRDTALGAAEVSLATADCRLQVLSRSGTMAHLKTLQMDGKLDSSTFLFTTQGPTSVAVAARPGLVVACGLTTGGLTVKLIQDGGTPFSPTWAFTPIAAPQSIVFTPGFTTIHARGGQSGYFNVPIADATFNAASTSSNCTSVVVSRAAATATDAQVLVGNRTGATCTVLAQDPSTSNTGLLVLSKPGLTPSMQGLVVGTDPALLAMSGGAALVLFRIGTELEIRRYGLNFSVNPPVATGPTTLNTLTTPNSSTVASELLAAPDGGGYYLVGTLNGAMTVDGTTTLTTDGGQPFVVRFGTDAGVEWARTYPSGADVLTRRAVILDDQLVIVGLCVGVGSPICPAADTPFAMSVAP